MAKKIIIGDKYVMIEWIKRLDTRKGLILAKVVPINKPVQSKKMRRDELNHNGKVYSLDQILKKEVVWYCRFKQKIP